MPKKLETQIKEMIKNNMDISCTDGYIGNGYFNKQKDYKIYNKEYYLDELKKIYKIEDFQK